MQVNHSFPPGANCAYTTLESPRLGPTVAVTTLRKVRPGSLHTRLQVLAGEELLVDYGYPDTVGSSLPWYRCLIMPQLTQGKHLKVTPGS